MAFSYGTKTGAVIAPTDLSQVYFTLRSANAGKVGTSTVWTQPIWTLKNSFAFDQVQGTKTEVNVDQTTAAIAVRYAAGTSTFSFRVPDMNEAVLGLFYTDVAPDAPGSGDIGTDQTGYGFSLALLTVTAYIVQIKYTNGWSIIFPHCEMVASLKKSGEDVWTIDIVGTVLAGDTNGEAADFIILQPTP
jgi:hypothetical protein